MAIGPCEFGDYDCDGSQDLLDYAQFSLVMSGPEVIVECSAFDSDGDRDVDLQDAAAFINAFDP